MPVPEKIPAGGRRVIRLRRRPRRVIAAARLARRLRRYLYAQRAGLLLWLTLTVVMIAVVLALSHGGGN